MSDIEIIKKYGSIENYIYELEQENKELKEKMAEIVKYKELESCSTATQYMAKANVYKMYDTHIKKLKEINDKLKQQLDLYKSICDECAEEILKELEENHHLSYGVALVIRQKLLNYEEILDKANGSDVK